jgi:hypothetical protein
MHRSTCSKAYVAALSTPLKKNEKNGRILLTDGPELLLSWIGKFKNKNKKIKINIVWGSFL